MNYELWKGAEPISGAQPRRPGRKFEIAAKDFTSVEQAAPVRLVYGRALVAGVQIIPIFGFRSEAIEQEHGK